MMFFHGEVVATKLAELPQGLKKIQAKDGRYIVADSETTFNHHCIKECEGVELYEKDGVIYMRNEMAATLFCVDESRHDTQVLEPGIWEIGSANEYDYLSDMKRKVAD